MLKRKRDKGVGGANWVAQIRYTKIKTIKNIIYRFLENRTIADQEVIQKL